MSLWGSLLNALYAFLEVSFNLNCSECLGCAVTAISPNKTISAFISYDKNTKIRAVKRIGPHNMDILSIIFGTLLGDGYAEKRVNGTRITFYQEGSHKDYLLLLHYLIYHTIACHS